MYECECEYVCVCVCVCVGVRACEGGWVGVRESLHEVCEYVCKG